MRDWLESAEAIGAVDAALAGVGVAHGKRRTRGGSWKDGERVRRPRSSNAASAKDGKAGAPGVLSVPAWKKLAWLRAGFSTRQGGASTAYGDGELNLGWTKEDDPAIVVRNRKRFIQAVAGKSPQLKSKMELATVRQFH